MRACTYCWRGEYVPTMSLPWSIEASKPLCSGTSPFVNSSSFPLVPVTQRMSEALQQVSPFCHCDLNNSWLRNSLLADHFFLFFFLSSFLFVRSSLGGSFLAFGTNIYSSIRLRPRVCFDLFELVTTTICTCSIAPLDVSLST